MNCRDASLPPCYACSRSKEREPFACRTRQLVTWLMFLRSTGKLSTHTINSAVGANPMMIEDPYVRYAVGALAPELLTHWECLEMLR